MDVDGNPRPIDTSTWAAFGSSQPLVWHESANMEANKGSVGKFAAHGIISLVNEGEELLTKRFTPAMMEFDGSTGYYVKTGITVSGNKTTMVGRFRRSSFTGGSAEYIGRYKASSYDRLAFFAFSNDHATPAKQDTISMVVINSAGAEVCRLMSPVGYLDGNEHTFMASFDGDAGTAQFIIDGVDVDDTGNTSRVAPTTGTLQTTASTLHVGAANSTPTNTLGGEVGFFGVHDVYTTDWTQFMDAQGNPKNFDGSGWLFWNEHGYMEDNKGTAGDMTKNGTIIVGEGGSS
jgi:hypothetical protein